jgi:hypothetical protein
VEKEMKKIILILIALTIPIFTLADQKAVTESGDEVILYKNGTWKYKNKDIEYEKTIPTNNTPFTKDKTSTFLLKSKKNNTGVWIDPKKWIVKTSVTNEAAEYEFQLKGEDLYGMVITERIKIPVESLIDIAIINAKKSSPDIKTVHKEYRTVNGHRIIHMQMKGTVFGIKMHYIGYYFSNARGTTQLITYTSQSLFDKYHEDAMKLLNGFIVK